MKFKAITVVFGALVASSFSAPITFGPSASADAADAVHPQAPAPETIKIPEFVPVVNFGEFVLAMQKFAAETPAASRLAAESLSAKFTSDDETPGAAKQPETAPVASVIVTRPVAIANMPVSGNDTSYPDLSAPDPSRPAIALADPVKIATGFPADRPAASTRKRVKKETVATSRERIEKKFEPAMGLGMVIDSAESAPPMSSLSQKKKPASGSRSAE